jgi:xylulose-5-phosphate/fructose-6-phosphate phosphoketolase
MQAVFEVTDRPVPRALPGRRPSSIDAQGRAGSSRSSPSTCCQGLGARAYLLTGRHGLFNCYEAFIHIVDSMFNQHAKWLHVHDRHPVAGGRSRR